MAQPETLLDALIDDLRAAGVYNRNDQVGPAAVLWPDEQRQWEPLLPLLRDGLPVFTLGDYDPDTHTGPAYWLRCVIGRSLPDPRLSDDDVPILYLPGYGKHHLRAIEDCPQPLKPLAELQYRGTLWIHRNGRDWTVTGFLHSLGVPVAADYDTKDALARALPRLAAEPVARLRKRAPLDATFFDELLHPDAVRQMLLWLSDSEGFRKRLTVDEWRAFRSLSRTRYEIDPAEDGPLSAAQRLSDATGEWTAVWTRYTEAPEAYPGIPSLLEKAQPTQLLLFESSPIWPGSNRAQEDTLRTALQELTNGLPAEVRQALLDLESIHGPRRDWVWATLGQAPLAQALEPSVLLAKLSEQPLAGDSVEEIAARYTSGGWRVDDAVLNALASVQHQEDVNAVKAAITPLYENWLREAATKLQQAVTIHPETYVPTPAPAVSSGTCVLFTDALRYDVGQALCADLERRGWPNEIRWGLAALPTVTETAKPAVSPASDQIAGGHEPGLSPVSAATGTNLTANSLRKLIQEAGWQVLEGDELGNPTGQAWTETGAIDSYGHQHGWRIAHHAQDEVRALADRVESLVNHGWRRVVLVTDHGWLMLPGGLRKAELPIHLTEVRKGRCAVLKAGAITDQQTVPWHWNSDVRIAIAPDICCYEAGKEYEHGGISPQECVIPIITIIAEKSEETVVDIEDVKWLGLRCRIQLSAHQQDLFVDLRSKAANPESSIALEPKAPDADGSISLIVPDEELEGTAVFVVVVTGDMLKAQTLTTVGG